MAKNQSEQNSKLVKELEELCIEVFAYSENDWEITLAGNGTNAYEASNMAFAVLRILHGDGRKWKEENAKRIKKRAAELRKQHGEEE